MESTPLQEVRWHVPARMFGIQLPPGYHILEAPLRFMLCFGDDEVQSYPVGVSPQQIQADARTHFGQRQGPAATVGEPESRPQGVGDQRAFGETLAQEPMLAPRGPGGSEMPGTAPEEMEAAGHAVQRRVVFAGIKMDITGPVATATVGIRYKDREIHQKSVGRNTEDRRVFLVAEATARAVTELLPPGYGVVIHDVKPAPVEAGDALVGVVLFLTPHKESFLLGIAPANGNPYEASARSVLDAVNRRLGLVLGD